MEERKSNFQQIEEISKQKSKFFQEKNNDEDLSSIHEEDNNKITIVPFKRYFLKIFKGPDDYYILDRHKYDINAIMMLLDLNKINKLSKIFQEYKDGIEKLIFINRMKSELPCNITDPMDETNLVYGLYKFFKEVDFNGDNQMQWNEFTQFIIDKVEGDTEAKVNPTEGEAVNKLYTEKQMIKFKRYHESKKLIDNLIHKHDVISTVFIAKMDTIVLTEYNTKIIKLYSPKNGKCEKSFDLDDYINPKLFIDSNKKAIKKNDEIELRIKKKKDQKKFTIEKNTNYTILYLYQYQNIIAMCLSDKRIVFINFVSEHHFDLIHEIQLNFLEKRIWYLPEHNIWVSSGCKIPGYDYFTLNELDIEFEHHNQKYECLYNQGHHFRYHFCENHPHMGEILDCIEITKPMLIITACMDSKIRLININEKSVVQIWSQHSLGVRSLNFNPYIENNGYILSVGFEYFINIYCTDISLEESYKGKLEGHYAPVITAKFLSNSYMAVSVDEECLVRIWDVKNKICLQVIPTPKKNFKIVNLLCLPKYNKFMVYGNKIIYYDPNYKEEKNLEMNEARTDNYPVSVEYNKYYQQFFIVTCFDVRVFDKDGNLDKIYRKLNMNDHFEIEPKIKFFLFENNHRKFYIGYSNGAIMQFNAGNGSLIKPINEKEIEKEGIQMYIYSHSKEISSLYYYYSDEDEKNQHLILLSSSYDSTINIFNEENPEETIKLKTIRGGHTIAGKHNEINCLDFSKILYSYATGSTDGLVIAWDFEISKINDIFYLASSNKHEKLSTLLVKFLDPYPLLAATYNDGTLYIWGVKQSKDRGNCIFRARNYFKHQNKINICPINSINIFYGELPDIKNKIIQLYDYFDENSPFMNPNKIYIPPKKIKNENDKYNEKAKEETDENLNLNIVPDIYKNEIIDIYNDPDLYEDNINENNEEHIRKRFYIFLGDSFGDIKLVDIYGLIKKNKYEKSSKITNKSSFNLLKKEDINVETILNHDLKPKDEHSLPKFTNMYYKMMCYEFRIHMDDITSIKIINEPLSFITSSKDKFVKIFNFNFECIGIINSLPKISKFEIPKVEWKFKINEEKILEDEINEVVSIFEHEEIEKIKVGSKSDEEVNNIDINEIIKQEQERKKKFDKGSIKRKFKYLEKENMKKNLINNDDKIDILYEDYYVREAQKNLEKKFHPKHEDKGMNEIMSNLIKTTVEIQKEEKIRKEKETEKILKELGINKQIEKKIKKKLHTKKQLSHLDSLNIKKNLVKVDLNKTYNPNIKTNKEKENLYLNYLDTDINKQNEIKNNNLKNISFNNKKKRSFTINIQTTAKKTELENVTPKERINIKFLPTIFESNIVKPKEKKEIIPIESNISTIKAENTIKSISKNTTNSSNQNYYNFGKPVKKEKPIKLRKELMNRKFLNISPNKREQSLKIKNSFFIEHLIKKKDRNKRKNKTFSNITPQDTFLKKLKHIDLDLPFVNDKIKDKIIFSKGETEKLLNYQFYKSSYNACFDINKHNSINNKCIKTNYDNNWNYVKQYTQEKDKKNRKLNNF